MNSTSTVASAITVPTPTIVLPTSTGCLTTGSHHGVKMSKVPGLNVDVSISAINSAVTNLLAVESNSTTPRTPEILNSVMAMCPLDDYNNFNASERCATGGLRGGSGNDSASNSSGSPLGSPANGTVPSVEKTRIELVKTCLKLSIESKRKASGSDSMDGLPITKKLKKEEPLYSEDEYDDPYSRHRTEGLTPEDEERRRRRRERNKIAATKCRLKKRERTFNLVSESESLETQNIDLKTQIQELEVERRQLTDMLSHHTPSCVKNNLNTSSPTQPYNPIQPPYDSPTNYPVSATPYEPNSPYLRPESANILASSYTCDLENPPPSNYSQPVDPMDMPNGYVIPATDGSYMRLENQNYINGDDPYIKNINYSNVDSSENEYIQTPFDNQEMNSHQYTNHTTSQQCHTRQKFRNSGMDSGCMA